MPDSHYPPGADITVGGWTPSAGGNLYGTVDEAVEDDADFVKSSQAPVGDVVELKFAGVVDPQNTSGNVVSYRLRGDSNMRVVASLVCGTTVIASWSHNPVPIVFTDYVQTLQPAEAAAIADYADLRLRLTAYANATALIVQASQVEALAATDTRNSIATRPASGLEVLSATVTTNWLSPQVIAAQRVEGLAAAEVPSASLNVSGGNYSGNWELRKSAPGVVRVFDFNDVSQLGLNADVKLGAFGYASSNVDYPPVIYPTLDPAMKCSGVSSLRFDLPSHSPGNASGSWYANFGDNYDVRFGANSRFYFQVRIRWNAALVDTTFYDQSANVPWNTNANVPTVTGAITFTVPANIAASLPNRTGIRARDAGGNPIAYASVNTAVFAAGVTTVTLWPLGQGTLTGMTAFDTGSVQLGIKFFDFIGGDSYVGLTPGPDGVTRYSSSDASKLVYQTVHQHNFPHIYRYYAGGTSALIDNQGGQQRYQNVIPPYCDAFLANTLAPKAVVPGCWTMPADQWVTFQTEIILGPDGIVWLRNAKVPTVISATQFTVVGDIVSSLPRSTDFQAINSVGSSIGIGTVNTATYSVGTNLTTVTLYTLTSGTLTGMTAFDIGLAVWLNSSVRLWVGLENQPSQLIIDYNPITTVGYKPLVRDTPAENKQLGKTYLFPYLTDKDYTQTHLPGVAWYDELVVSTQKIADPVSNPLDDLQPNMVRDLGVYANPAVQFGLYIQDDSGWCYDKKRKRILMWGGGHGPSYETDIRAFDLTTCSGWTSLYPSITYAETVTGNYDKTLGRWINVAGQTTSHPGARHTYNSLTVVDDKFYMMCATPLPRPYLSSYGDTTLWSDSGVYTQGRLCWHDFNGVTGNWTFSNFDHTGSSWFQFCGAQYDAASGKVIVVGINYQNADGWLKIWAYDPVADTAVQLYPPGPAILVGGGMDLVYVSATDTYYIVNVNTPTSYAPSPNMDNIWSFQLTRTVPTAPTVSTVTHPPEVGEPILDISAYGSTGGNPPRPNAWAYDLPSNSIVGGIMNGKINAYNLTTNTWSQKQMLFESNGQPCGFQILQGVECMVIDEDSGCVVFLTNPDQGAPYSGRTYAYRYAP